MAVDEKYFTVSKYEEQGRLDDIFFGVNETVNEFPDSIIKLKDDIELSVIVLQKLYEKDTFMYNFYYKRVYVLADLAFNGQISQVSLAQNGLEKIKSEIIFNSSPSIRNEILLKFIKLIYIPVILAFMIYLGLTHFTDSDALHYIGNLFLVALGSCLGCWLSLAFRTRFFEFKEILSIISDGQGITTRVIFVIVFSISLALLMKIDVLTVNLGGFSSKAIATDPFMAFAGGMIMGFGEKIFVESFQKKMSAIKF
ncbi:hypothetical protein ACT4KF_002176 [Yersinia enterocolitica]